MDYLVYNDPEIAQCIDQCRPHTNPILLCQVFWAIGTVFEVVLAVFVMPSLGWRWLLILSAVPLLIFAVLCFVGIFSEISNSTT